MAAVTAVPCPKRSTEVRLERPVAHGHTLSHAADVRMIGVHAAVDDGDPHSAASVCAEIHVSVWHADRCSGPHPSGAESHRATGDPTPANSVGKRAPPRLELHRLSLLDDAAVAEHEHAVGGSGQRQTVGDEIVVRPRIACLVAGQDLPLGCRIQRRGRLVEDEHIRIDEKRPCDGDALPLAGRQRGPRSPTTV